MVGFVGAAMMSVPTSALAEVPEVEFRCGRGSSSGDPTIGEASHDGHAEESKTPNPFVRFGSAFLEFGDFCLRDGGLLSTIFVCRTSRGSCNRGRTRFARILESARSERGGSIDSRRRTKTKLDGTAATQTQAHACRSTARRRKRTVKRLSLRRKSQAVAPAVSVRWRISRTPRKSRWAEIAWRTSDIRHCQVARAWSDVTVPQDDHAD